MPRFDCPAPFGLGGRLIACCIARRRMCGWLDFFRERTHGEKERVNGFIRPAIVTIPTTGIPLRVARLATDCAVIVHLVRGCIQSILRRCNRITRPSHPTRRLAVAILTVRLGGLHTEKSLSPSPVHISVTMAVHTLHAGLCHQTGGMLWVGFLSKEGVSHSGVARDAVLGFRARLEMVACRTGPQQVSSVGLFHMATGTSCVTIIAIDLEMKHSFFLAKGIN